MNKGTIIEALHNQSGRKLRYLVIDTKPNQNELRLVNLNQYNLMFNFVAKTSEEIIRYIEEKLGCRITYISERNNYMK